MLDDRDDPITVTITARRQRGKSTLARYIQAVLQDAGVTVHYQNSQGDNTRRHVEMAYPLNNGYSSALTIKERFKPELCKHVVIIDT